jgi:hypothetical protein
MEVAIMYMFADVGHGGRENDMEVAIMYVFSDVGHGEGKTTWS